VPQANHPDKKGVAQANQTVKEQILKGYDAETRKINFYFSFSVSFKILILIIFLKNKIEIIIALSLLNKSYYR
jgi:hypothetical protein